MKNNGKFFLALCLVFFSMLAFTLSSASYEVRYKCGSTGAATSQMQPHFMIYNNSGASVALSNLKVRYYYTKEGTASETAYMDYIAIGSANIAVSFQTGYVEMGFTASAGNIANGGNSGEIQLRIAKSDWSNYDQSNDYSFAPAMTAYTAHSKVTLYLNGSLVWGTEPGGTVATPTPAITSSTISPTRTATAAPTRTATRTTTTAPTRTATRTRTTSRTATRTTTRTAIVTRTATATRTATRTTVVTPTPTPAPGRVSILPATQSVANGSSFTNEIRVNTGTEMICAYGFDVSYNSALISVNTAIGTSGVSAGTEGYVSAVNTNTADHLVIAGFDTTGKGPGTNLQLVVINWTARAAGTCTLGISINSFVNGSYATIGNPAGTGASVTIN